MANLDMSGHLQSHIRVPLLGTVPPRTHATEMGN